MTFPQGINFRSSAGYVTDGANDHPETTSGGTENYPDVSAQGNNVGWETIGGNNLAPENQNSGVDPRLAGCMYHAGAGGTDTYRIDLAQTGTHRTTLAAGEYSNPTTATVNLFDTSTALGTICNGNTNATTNWLDATNVLRTSATDWVDNNVTVDKVYATTIYRLDITAFSGNDRSIAHFSVDFIVTLTRDQHATRAFENDDSEDLSTALAAEDTDAELPAADICQGRIGVQYTDNPPSESAQWQYSEDGDNDFRKMT